MESQQDERPGYKLIFRRYRKDQNGNLLDARKYGLKAWAMWVKEGE